MKWNELHGSALFEKMTSDLRMRLVVSRIEIFLNEMRSLMLGCVSGWNNNGGVLGMLGI